MTGTGPCFSCGAIFRVAGGGIRSSGVVILASGMVLSDCWADDSDRFLVSAVSVNAGFNLSTEIFVVLLFIRTAYTLAERFITSYGPSYGRVSAGLTLSLRTKTYVQSCSAGCMNGLSDAWFDGELGRNSLNHSRSSVTNSVVSFGGLDTSISPGIRMFCPKTSSAAVAFTSGLNAVRKASSINGSFVVHFVVSCAISADLRVL